MQAGLIAKRKVAQTWAAAISARGEETRRSAALLARFEQLVAEGTSEGEAAYRVLSDAGLLWRLDEPSLPEPAVPVQP